MNAPRTLRELLEEASGHGELSTRQLEMKVDAARENGRLRSRLNRATIAQILNGSYKSRPTDDTIRAIAYLAGVDDEVAFTAAGRRTPGRPFAEDLPDGVDDLTPKEREAAVYMLRVLVQQRRELNHHEDQDQTRTAGATPAARGGGARRAPMSEPHGGSLRTSEGDVDLAAQVDEFGDEDEDHETGAAEAAETPGNVRR